MNWTGRDINKPFVWRIRNNFHTRLIINMPTGGGYIFELDETKEITNLQDVEYLLGLKYNQTACCGNPPPGPINYFVMEA